MQRFVRQLGLLQAIDIVLCVSVITQGSRDWQVIVTNTAGVQWAYRGLSTKIREIVLPSHLIQKQIQGLVFPTFPRTVLKHFYVSYSNIQL